MQELADDNTPLDEAWLLSVGAKTWVREGTPRFLILGSLEWESLNGELLIHARIPEPTRGDVRQLAAALGIALKETT